jgi:hypothetical protein
MDSGTHDRLLSRFAIRRLALAIDSDDRCRGRRGLTHERRPSKILDDFTVTC